MDYNLKTLVYFELVFWCASMLCSCRYFIIETALTSLITSPLLVVSEPLSNTFCQKKQGLIENAH